MKQFNIDHGYHDLLKEIVYGDFAYNYEDTNRKGVIRREISSYKIQHNLLSGFPALTTKKLYWKGVVGELLWFLRGDTNIKYLVENNIHIWDKDAANYNKNGDLGRVYGAQWRSWSNISITPGGYADVDKVDQISNLIKGLKENPMSTRHIVTAWNPAELDNMALPPCHWSFEILPQPLAEQKGVTKYGFILKWHQRSVDTFLGLPFNIASYALLAHIIGKFVNMIPLGIEGDLSRVHIYGEHKEAVLEQLKRNVNTYDAPDFILPDVVDGETIDNYLNRVTINDFKLDNYASYPSIPAKMLAYNK